jgi:hypothetical protein
MKINKQYVREKINPLLIFLYKLYGVKIHDNLLFCSLDEKRAFIKSTYSKRTDIKTFIETGTYKGDAIEYIKNDFENIFTIELSDKYADESINRFKNESKIKIIKGDSGVELPKLLNDISGPCVFWLDGHYSYKGTAMSNKETPILEELKPILLRSENNIILIDDARLFIGTHSYPTIFSLVKFVKKYNKSYKISIIKDIIVLEK